MEADPPPPCAPPPWSPPVRPGQSGQPCPGPARYGVRPDPRPLARRLAAPLGAIAAVAAAFAYVGSVDPNEPGHYPVCPLWQLTGVYCPGCGGLRSAHAFVHGQLGTALGDNALAVLGYGVFAVLCVVWLVRAVRGRSFTFVLRPRYAWVLGVAALLFTVARNLPFGAALAP